MTTPTGNIFIWVGDQMACIRITGRANFTSSVDFKKLIRHLRDSGQKNVVLDLSECLLMDSTFLGVLASEAHKRATSAEGGSEPGFELVNPNQRIRDLIENLGILSLFKITECDLSKENFKAVEGEAEVSREEVTRTCLEAHQTLMALHPDNVAKFKDVTHFFAENLKKLQGKP